MRACVLLGLFSTLQTWSRGGQAGGTDIHEFRALSQHALRGSPQEEKKGTSPLVTKDWNQCARRAWEMYVSIAQTRLND